MANRHVPAGQKMMTFLAPEPFAAALDEVAAAEQLSRSETIRAAVAEYLSRRGREVPAA